MMVHHYHHRHRRPHSLWIRWKINNQHHHEKDECDKYSVPPARHGCGGSSIWISTLPLGTTRRCSGGVQQSWADVVVLQ
jgi:hypothetical protein